VLVVVSFAVCLIGSPSFASLCLQSMPTHFSCQQSWPIEFAY